MSRENESKSRNDITFQFPAGDDTRANSRQLSFVCFFVTLVHSMQLIPGYSFSENVYTLFIPVARLSHPKIQHART